MNFIRGDTFQFAGPVTLTVNSVDITDLTDYEATSQIRSSMDTLIDTLEVVWLSRSPAMIQINASGSTQAWPVGEAKIDIEFVSPSGDIISTRAQTFTIVKDVTRPVP